MIQSPSSNPLLVNYERGKYTFKSFAELNQEEVLLILSWRNHDSIRKWMFNKEAISEKDHISFITSLPEKSDKAYWLVLKKDKPVAVVNLINLQYDTCEWGIYVRPDMIGAGLGIEVQFHFLNVLFTEIGIKNLLAFVHTHNSENINVQRLFEFLVEDELSYIGDTPFHKLVLSRQKWESLEKDLLTFKLARLLRRK